MDAKQLAVGTIVGGVVLYAVGYLIFDVAVFDFYLANTGSATGVFRDATLVWAILLSDLALALFVSLCIARTGAPTIGRGFAAGGAIGFFVWFHTDFTLYGYTNIWNLTVTILDPLLEIVHVGVSGAVIALVLGMMPKAA